jgi:hypothetical protein
MSPTVVGLCGIDPKIPLPGPLPKGEGKRSTVDGHDRDRDQLKKSDRVRACNVTAWRQAILENEVVLEMLSHD